MIQSAVYLTQSLHLEGNELLRNHKKSIHHTKEDANANVNVQKEF